MNRIERYNDFEEFANSAEDTFNALLTSDSRAKEFSTFYSFYVQKGGAMGGIDKRIVEVFFGNRAIDRVETLRFQDGRFPQKQSDLLSEGGACLRYERTDAGTVICTLIPATTKTSRQQEDYILLEWIANPRVLHSKRKVMAHWLSLLSYMQCTSLDGEPTSSEKLRVGYLRLTRHLVVDGRTEKKRITAFIGSILHYALTIGLSGFLLMLISVFGGSKEMEKLQADQTSLARELSETRSFSKAQSERIISLEQRIDAMPRIVQKSDLGLNQKFLDKAGQRHLP